MRLLAEHEFDVVSGGFAIGRFGGWVGRLFRDGLAWEAVTNIGPGPASSSTRNFGVVGPGSSYNTDPSSVGAINGHDSMSDGYSGNGPGGFF